MLQYFACAVLAPAVACAAAFQWSLPEPTHFVAAIDAWSPAPTVAPALPGFALFKREENQGANTCGFVSGLSESSITCQNTAAICATDTYLGVHGCCDPSALSSCTIPTTCIPATAMSTACTDSSCSSGAATVKCTAAGLTECYQWLFNYDTTTMTQHGCAASSFTLSASRSWAVSKDTTTVTVTAPPATTPTPSPDPPATASAPSSSPSKPNLGVIIGATIGACIFFTALALVAFLVHRKRHAAHPTTNARANPQYNTLGSPSPSFPDSSPQMGYAPFDAKTWQHQQHQQQIHGVVHRASDAVPEYPGMRHAGVVEVEGVQRPVEADAGVGWGKR